MPDTLTAAPQALAARREPKEDPAWLRRALAGYGPKWPRHDSCRRHEPDSPESVLLREQAARDPRKNGGAR